MTDTTRERRLRRMADRQGLQLRKSRQRDPRGLDHGTYGLADKGTDETVAATTSTGYGLTLDDVERHLNPTPKDTP